MDNSMIMFDIISHALQHFRKNSLTLLVIFADQNILRGFPEGMLMEQTFFASSSANAKSSTLHLQRGASD